MHIDPSIIEGCRKNDRKAQEKLYMQLYPYLMGICYRYFISKETSKEIVNTSMLKILTQIHQYDDKYPFKVWAAKITINTILDEMRKNKKHQNINYVENYYDDNQYAEMNNALSKINVNEILQLIEKLNETERSVFNLYCIDGYSHQEIANILNINEGTSKWYLNQARTKLKDMMKKLYSISL